MVRPALSIPTGTCVAHVVVTDRADGDLAVDGSPDELEARRRAVVDMPWTWFRQVHGTRVVRVTHPGGGAGAEADAAVSRVADAALAIQVADCAPVALVGADGVIAAAHVGWRGLVEGVLPATIDAMATRGVRAVVGPCIHAECYEFGADDLEAVSAVAGERVRATTSSGRPALDLPAGISAVLDALDVEVLESPWASACTACSPGWWSHRARAERERQAMVVWMTES